MKLKKQKENSKKQKKYIFKESDVKKIVHEATQEATETAILFFLCWLADTGYIDGDIDTLKAEYDRLEGWFKAYDDGLIKARDLKRMLQDKTGEKIKVVR